MVSTPSSPRTPSTRLASPTKRASSGSAGWVYRSCGAAHWAIWPPRSTATWSAVDRASSWSWVTSTAVVAGLAQQALDVGPDGGAQAGVEGREGLVQQDQRGA